MLMYSLLAILNENRAKKFLCSQMLVVCCEQRRQTPIHAAAEAGMVNIVKALIEGGARLDTHDEVLHHLWYLLLAKYQGLAL